jgi:hypothetical protein
MLKDKGLHRATRAERNEAMARLVRGAMPPEAFRPEGA